MFDQLGKYFAFLAVLVFACGVLFALGLSFVWNWLF